jgi:hypothetical protein
MANLPINPMACGFLPTKTSISNGGQHTMKRQMHLNLFIHGRGHHEASWRHPAASPLSLSDIRYYQTLAQQAEAGLFERTSWRLAMISRTALARRSSLSPCWRRWP